MTVRETCLQALRSMRAMPLRAFLTTFGIAVGVAAVVVLVALGNGIRTGFEQSLFSFSTTIGVSQQQAGNSGGNGTRQLRDRDARAIATQVPGVTAVVPSITGTAFLRHDGKVFSGRVTGASEQYPAAQNYRLSAGRMFTAGERAARSQVAVMGQSSLRYLFDGDEQRALRSEIQIGRATYRVVGVLAATAADDDTVVIPLESARSSIYAKNDKLGLISLQVASPDQVDPTVAAIQQVMDRQHLIRDPGVRDYTVFVSASQVKKTLAFLDLLTSFTVGVAGIALLVGALGVANIMLVAVTERTREIGLLKAIGARRGAIVRQFLIEAMILGGIGGLFGVVLGVGLTLAGSSIVPSVVPNAAPPELSVLSIVISLAVSLVIGVLAGIFPAFRAASMRPVKALSY